MTPEVTAEALTATLVQMEYPRDEVHAAVVKRFPDADVDALIAAAQERKRRQTASSPTRNPRTSARPMG